MSRSLRKFVNNNYRFSTKIMLNNFSEIIELKKLRNEAIKKNWFLNKELFVVTDKSTIIWDFMIGLYFLVYIGNTYQLIFIKENMVGYRIGEFVTTKSLGEQIHTTKRKKK